MGGLGRLGRRRAGEGAGIDGRLPTFVVIGAMKCGTSALHSLLGEHPQIGVAAAKELNFFAGKWWRGIAWYASRFPPAPARGETSPAYTSPSFPEAAGRLRATLPEARLIYMLRDPLERAISQYLHHRRDGTEPRPLAEALLDPGSQYVARSRYWRRLEPFAERFPHSRIMVVAQERLRLRPAELLAELDRFLDVDPAARPAAPPPRPPRRRAPSAPPELRARFEALVAGDLAQLARAFPAARSLQGDETRADIGVYERATDAGDSPRQAGLARSPGPRYTF